MKERPNILWVMTDEQRVDSMGCYGSPWARTPVLDRLASEGVVFDEAVTPAPVCIPARLSMLTGLYPHQTGVWYNEPRHGKTFDFLTDRFRAAGYRTATFGKQHYGAANRAFEHEEQLILTDAVDYLGYNKRYDQEKYDVLQYPKEPWPWVFGGRFPESAERTSEAVAARRALEWLDEGKRGEPFFLRVSFNGPHTPVAPPAPFDTLIDPSSIHLPPEAEGRPEGEPEWLAKTLRAKAEGTRLTAAQVQRMRQCYYGEVAFLDTLVGRLMEGLAARGLAENMAVAFVSDHGAHLGDYAMVQKQTFYEPSVRVPMFVRWPGRAASGRRVRTPVETVGLVAALVELAGLESPDVAAGRRLAEVLRTGEEPEARPVYSELTLSNMPEVADERMVMVRDGRWKASCRYAPGRCDETLHDLEADPWERRNLAGEAGCGEVLGRMLGLIERHLAG